MSIGSALKGAVCWFRDTQKPVKKTKTQKAVIAKVRNFTHAVANDARALVSHRGTSVPHTRGRKFYVFFYEYEGRGKNRKSVYESGRPKEYLGPFDSKQAATTARDVDVRKYGSKKNDYKIRNLTPAMFAKTWGSNNV